MRYFAIVKHDIREDFSVHYNYFTTACKYKGKIIPIHRIGKQDNLVDGLYTNVRGSLLGKPILMHKTYIQEILPEQEARDKYPEYFI